MPTPSRNCFTALALRFQRDASGNVAVLGACFALVAAALTAIVTDWGSMYLERRDQQGVTDLAALIAARNLATPDVAANSVVTANGIAPTAPLSVTVGHYAPDKAQAAADRFVPNGTPVNAVRVEVPADTPLFFGKWMAGGETVPIVTVATAAITQQAAHSIGSRLASLDGGVANSLLGGMLGGNVSLSAMDYDALVDSHVGLFEFADALATEVDMTGGTYSELADTDVTVGDLLNAMAAAGVVGESSYAAEAALSHIGQHSQADTLTIPAGKLFQLGPYASLAAGDEAGFDAGVRAMDIVNAAAQVANEDHQVALSFGSSIPGLLDLSATVLVGERPQGSSWIAVGDPGSTVHTAQTRIRFDATVGGSGILAGQQINVPILVDIASGESTLQSIACGDDPATDALVGLSARPSVADLWIGEPIAGWTNFDVTPTVVPATLVNVPLLARVNASAHTAVTNVNDTPVDFTAEQIAAHHIETVSTTTPVTTAVASLLGNTSLDVQALGLSIGVGAVGSLVESLLAPVGPAVDPILMSLLDQLGVGIGEADVWVNGVRCDGSVLVN